jgi:hypothetical protein
MIDKIQEVIELSAKGYVDAFQYAFKTRGMFISDSEAYQLAKEFLYSTMPADPAALEAVANQLITMGMHIKPQN